MRIVLVLIGLFAGYFGGLLSFLLFFVNLKKEISLQAILFGLVTLVIFFGLGSGGGLLIAKLANRISDTSIKFNQDLLILYGIAYLTSAATMIIYLHFFAK